MAIPQPSTILHSDHYAATKMPSHHDVLAVAEILPKAFAFLALVPVSHPTVSLAVQSHLIMDMILALHGKLPGNQFQLKKTWKSSVMIPAEFAPWLDRAG